MPTSIRRSVTGNPELVSNNHVDGQGELEDYPLEKASRAWEAHWKTNFLYRVPPAPWNLTRELWKTFHASTSMIVTLRPTSWKLTGWFWISNFLLRVHFHDYEPSPQHGS